MTADYTDKQLDKRVVDQKGVEVGTVTDVRNGDLYVTVGPKADRDTLDDLRWTGTVNQEVHQLRHEFIGDVSEHEIRLNVG